MEPMRPMGPMEPMRPIEPMEPMRPMEPMKPFPQNSPEETYSISIATNPDASVHIASQNTAAITQPFTM